LPRYIGVLSVNDDSGKHLLDALVDASEVERISEVPTVVGWVGAGIPKTSPAGAAVVGLATVLAQMHSAWRGSGATSPPPVLLARV
jgi:hypothetical protein